MAVVTEECDACHGEGWVKTACCDWCKSYDVTTCAECGGDGLDVYDDDPPTYDRWTIGFGVTFPQVSVRRGGIFYNTRPTPAPDYPPLEDRADLWGDA
jgi:hypothetical protein